MDSSRTVLGTFVTPVAGVPGVYHVGYYFTEVGEGGRLETTVIQAFPTNRLPPSDEATQTMKGLVGIRNPDSPFGPIQVEAQHRVGDLKDIIPHAIAIRPLSQGDNIHGEIGEQWKKIVDVYNAAESAAYLPFQNSNTVAYLAGQNAGVAWPYTPSTAPVSRQNAADRTPDHINVRTGRESSSLFELVPDQLEFVPWTPGAANPLDVPYLGSKGAPPRQPSGRLTLPILPKSDRSEKDPTLDPTPAFQPDAVYSPTGDFYGNYPSSSPSARSTTSATPAAGSNYANGDSPEAPISYGVRSRNVMLLDPDQPGLRAAVPWSNDPIGVSNGSPAIPPLVRPLAPPPSSTPSAPQSPQTSDFSLPSPQPRGISDIGGGSPSGWRGLLAGLPSGPRATGYEPLLVRPVTPPFSWAPSFMPDPLQTSARSFPSPALPTQSGSDDDYSLMPRLQSLFDNLRVGGRPAEPDAIDSQSNATARALSAKGVPTADIEAAMGNPDLMRQLLSQYYGGGS